MQPHCGSVHLRTVSDVFEIQSLEKKSQKHLSKTNYLKLFLLLLLRLFWLLVSVVGRSGAAPGKFLRGINGAVQAQVWGKWPVLPGGFTTGRWC